MNQPPYGPPGGYGPPPGGYGGPPPGGFGPPGGNFGGPPGGFGPPPFNPNPGQQRTSTLAIVALVSGILGLTCCGFLAGLPAIICGFMARGETERDPNVSGGGMAIAGIVMGFLSIVWTIIAIAGGFLNAIMRSMH